MVSLLLLLFSGLIRDSFNLFINKVLDIIKAKHSDFILKGKYKLIDKDAEGGRFRIFLGNDYYKKQSKAIVECTKINYRYSFKISVRPNGMDLYDEEYRPSEIIPDDPLTLAYI